jgi:hypothetical protein
MDTADKMAAFEKNKLDTHGIITLFSDLIRTGLAWKLKRSYGQHANQFIERGFISRTGKVRWTKLEKALYKV